jgi:hypothetical protein
MPLHSYLYKYSKIYHDIDTQKTVFSYKKSSMKSTGYAAGFCLFTPSGGLHTTLVEIVRN